MTFKEFAKESKKTIIIAEAGINHDGDIKKAKKMSEIPEL